MRPDKEFAKKHGIPRWLRCYSARYGRGVGAVMRDYLKYPAVGLLNHGRDRALKRIGVASLPTRTPIEGIIHAA